MRVTDDSIHAHLPYARPKVGRRASDRKVLDEWYADWSRREQPPIGLDREDTEQRPAEQ